MTTSYSLKTVRATLVLIATVMALHPAVASDTSCEYSVTKGVHFSSRTAVERLTVAIEGGECYKATLTLLVTDAKGGVLYSYTAPFKRHTALQWDDPGLPIEARRVADDMLQHAMVAPRVRIVVGAPGDRQGVGGGSPLQRRNSESHWPRPLVRRSVTVPARQSMSSRLSDETSPLLSPRSRAQRTIAAVRRIDGPGRFKDLFS